MFIVENGDVSLCFQAEPVGNLYETPLVEIWNSPAAVAKRSRMLAGRCLESGCSKLWCEWRDKITFEDQPEETRRELLEMFKALTQRLQATGQSVEADDEVDTKLGAVRRLLRQRNSRISELEANLAQLWDDNAKLHENGQAYIEHLENELSLHQNDKSE